MKNIINTQEILKFIEQNKLSKTKFCKMCKISYSTFKKIIDGYINFDIKALFKIAKVMDVHIKTLFNKI